MAKKIKVGVFGGNRGLTMVNVMARHPHAELSAICDRNPVLLERARRAADKAGRKVALFRRFEDFLNSDMDAAVVSNDATEHVPFAVRLLESGRHVTSEVVAFQTMAEAVRLVETVEKTKRVYAFAENYCYFRGTWAMREIYRRGDIGEFLHGEGEYVHDCESIWPRITYGSPGHWRNWVPATFYCTHSMGPIVTITGTRPVRVSAYETQNIVKQTFGNRGADGSVVVCQMDNGATVKILPWANFRRAPEAIWYCIYGSKGMMETDRWGETFNRIHVYRQDTKRTGKKRACTPVFPFKTKESVRVAGHSGSDFYTMHYFLEAIRTGDTKNLVDVYQAADMTLPGLLGYKSIYRGNVPVDVPDLRKKSVRNRFRRDNWCLDPKYAGKGQPRGSSREERAGTLRISPSVYRKTAREVKGFFK
jgi:predicted dehydrogenase